MERRFTFNLFVLLSVSLIQLYGGVYAQNDVVKMRFFDEVVFYDGYRVRDNPDKDKFSNDGILRNYTYLYAVKMLPEQLDQFGDSVAMNVWVKACCDNYDRIGNINLALIDKDSIEYDPFCNTETRIELGRFITPFMDKNKQPDVVPYSYRVDYLSHIFRDRTLREKYNFWLEFELFGVPYAANKQIAGCADRSDVFFGTLEFATSAPAGELTDKNVLVPVAIKYPEYMGGKNLNNYDGNCTDTIGKTVKTYTFEVPVDVQDGQLVVVTSNHGANENGEEYNRRWHFVYLDDELVLTYMPGRTSCEPFRKYNTQLNGIYGYVNVGPVFRPIYDGQNCSMTDEEWQSFSNWCPGDVIDNRIIRLGAVKAGTHKVRLSVPDAVFAGGQGFFPVSIFFQGLTEGVLPDGIDEVTQQKQQVRISFDGRLLAAESDETILSLEIYDVQGNRRYYAEGDTPVNLSAYPAGLYLVNVELANGIIATHKVVK